MTNKQGTLRNTGNDVSGIVEKFYRLSGKVCAKRFGELYLLHATKN